MDECGALVEWIVHEAGDAIIYDDRSGTIRRWNCALSTLPGVSSEEALVNLVFPIPFAPGVGAAIASAASKLAGRPTLTRATHKSGRKLSVEMTCALVGNDRAAEESVAVAREREAASEDLNRGQGAAPIRSA